MRALLVSYSFPPVGGAGVQRVLKLVKYLPQHGVRPAVLTVKNPSVPVRDESLFSDVPPDVEVIRARTFEPGYGVKQAGWAATAAGPATWRTRLVRHLTGAARQLLHPDPQVLWQPAAQVALLSRLVRPGAEPVVLISGPPFSQFLLAPLSRLAGAAVVLDYRDEWSTYRTAYEMGGSRGGLGGDPLEHGLLRCAQLVTTATPEFRDNLLRRFPFLDPGRVRAIPNGYDPEDFPANLPGPPPDARRLVLSYAGTIFRLTSARGLLSAIRRLHQAEPDLARLLDVRFMGRIVDTELDAFAGTEALGVTRLGYLDHKAVLAELSRSHLLLCLLGDVPGAERIYPGKVFELMYLRRPCLVLAPEGALTRLCARHHLGTVLSPDDEAGIAAFLADRLRRFRDGLPDDASPRHDGEQGPGIARYDRRALAGEFAEVLREAAQIRRRWGGAPRDFSFDQAAVPP